MKSDVLPAPKGECYIWDLARCSEDEKEWVFDGSAVVKDWIVVGSEGRPDILSPTLEYMIPLQQ